MTIKNLFLSTTLAALIIVAAASSTLANEHEKDHAAPTSTETAPATPAEDAKKSDDHKDHDKIPYLGNLILTLNCYLQGKFEKEELRLKSLKQQNSQRESGKITYWSPLRAGEISPGMGMAITDEVVLVGLSELLLNQNVLVAN